MTEFQKWLEAHKDKFLAYSNQEISELALACGFDRKEVAQWLNEKTFRMA